MRISDWSSDVCSSDLLGRDVAGDRAVADIGVDLDQEIAADRHRLAFGVVDVVGDDRAAARYFVADEFGGDIIGNAGAPVLPIAFIVGQAFAAEILAGRDIVHFRRDDPLTGIVHLADIGAAAGARHGLAHGGEGGDAARPVGAELAVILAIGRAHV